MSFDSFMQGYVSAGGGQPIGTALADRMQQNRVQAIINQVAAERDAALREVQALRQECERRKLSAYKYERTSHALLQTITEKLGVTNAEARTMAKPKIAASKAQYPYDGFGCPTQGGILNDV